MSNYDFNGNRSRRPMQMWDILSILMLVITVCLIGYFALVFINPGSSLNPFPPGGRGMFGPNLPTLTPTPIQLEPTWTPSPTIVVTATNTFRPTFTPLPTETLVSLIPPSKTPKPTNTARPTSTPKAAFTVSSVTTVDSTVIHPDLTCNWAGIGGTVVDSNNSPILGMVVVLRGSLSGKSVDLTTVSGINPEYGQSGFEFVIGDVPVSSTKTLYVQLLDLNNIPLSDKVEITTSSDCTKNLVIVRFKKNR